MKPAHTTAQTFTPTETLNGYKKGDKLLCKKGLVGLSNKDEFFAGKTYTIDLFDGRDNSLFIRNTENKKINLPHLEGIWFSFNKEESDLLYYLYDYFYSPQELRKLKLQKLAEQ
jgi:hypothetical protein